MIRSFAHLFALLIFASPALAETLVAARTIRSQSIISPQDLALAPGENGGALQHPSAAVGLEARVMIYQGRPIRAEDIGPPALVERNQVVQLIYKSGGLTIAADGRVLDRGGVGDRLRVMNLSSRTTVTGVVTSSGYVLVTPGIAATN